MLKVYLIKYFKINFDSFKTLPKAVAEASLMGNLDKLR